MKFFFVLFLCLQQKRLKADVTATLDKAQQISKSASDLGSAETAELIKDLPKNQALLGQVNDELKVVKSKVTSFENIESLAKADFLKVFTKQNQGKRAFSSHI